MTYPEKRSILPITLNLNEVCAEFWPTNTQCIKDRIQIDNILVRINARLNGFKTLLYFIMGGVGSTFHIPRIGGNPSSGIHNRHTHKHVVTDVILLRSIIKSDGKCPLPGKRVALRILIA